MEIIYFKKSIQQKISCVATIGMFDGVHQGHRFVLRHVCDFAKANGLLSMCITFDQHPREVVKSDWHPQLLTTFEERIQLLSQTDIDLCVILRFTKEMAAMSAHDFMTLMRNQLGVKVLMTGYDNRFGHDRETTFEDYVKFGEEMGMEVKGLSPAPSTSERGGVVSSSVIRRFLEKGDVREAATCLTYPYQLSGVVVKGEHIGTTLGFPTANLQPNNPHKQIPAAGVYAVRCTMDDEKWKMLWGMMNIGTRPTFGEHRQTLEVHILGYKGNLYGKTITVEFIERLRDERRFANEEELVTQLKEDELKVERLKLKG